jgi:hypothetical protein
MAITIYPVPRGIVAALRGEKCYLCGNRRLPSVRVPVSCQRFDTFSSGTRRPNTPGGLCGLCNPFFDLLRPTRPEARQHGVICVSCAEYCWREEGRNMPGCAIWISPDERRRRKRAGARAAVTA